MIQTFKNIKLRKLFLAALLLGVAGMTSLFAQTSGQTPGLPPHDDGNDQPGIPQTTVTQTTELERGWNWFSIYVEGSDPVAILDMLKQSLGDNGLQIVSVDYTTEYDGEEWFGDLDEVGMVNEQLYFIETSTECTVEMEGTLANPAAHPITINPGWNWIGFPSATALEVSEALSEFEAEDGDMLMSIDHTTEYDDGEWFGDLETLQPKQGLLYFSASTATKSLVFKSN